MIEKHGKTPDASYRTNAFGKSLEEWTDEVRRLLEEGYTVEFTPLGFSMWPTLCPGIDTVFLQAANSYSPSDIVLAVYGNPRTVVLHRVKKIVPGGYILMGDSNLYRTERCGATDVLGMVVGIERDGRDISNSRSRRVMTAVQRLPDSARRLCVRIINLARYAH